MQEVVEIHSDIQNETFPEIQVQIGHYIKKPGLCEISFLLFLVIWYFCNSGL